MTGKCLLFGASVLFNLALLWTLICGEQGFVTYRSLRNELMALTERNQVLVQKNIQLSREIKLLESDNKFTEQMIRKRLNFIKENEIWYIFPENNTVEGADETEN